MDTLLSVEIITFNQRDYIAQCIDSVLMQRISFSMEIVIGEDCSTDGTKEIVTEYAKKYSNLIRVVTSDFNVGPQPNSIRTLNACRGKYIALCEGDDYWIDPYKLQKQVDFLESHADYGLVHTDYKRYSQDSGEYFDSPIRINKTSVPDGLIYEALLEKNYIGTLTVLARRELILSVSEDILLHSKTWLMGDYPVWLELSRHCKVKYFKDQTAVYRISPNTLSRPAETLGKFNFFKSIFDIRFYFIEKYVCPNNQRERILNSYFRLLVIGSVVLNDKGLREWLFLLALKSNIIMLITRIFVKIAQIIEYNSFLDYSVS
jgi:glycosyltransferase involved in cell wall biosynthesis